MRIVKGTHWLTINIKDGSKERAARIDRDGLFHVGAIKLASSGAVAGFAGPNGAIFPYDAIVANVTTQPTLPVPSIHVAAPAYF